MHGHGAVANKQASTGNFNSTHMQTSNESAPDIGLEGCWEQPLPVTAFNLLIPLATKKTRIYIDHMQAEKTGAHMTPKRLNTGRMLFCPVLRN